MTQRSTGAGQALTRPAKDCHGGSAGSSTGASRANLHASSAIPRLRSWLCARACPIVYIRVSAAARASRAPSVRAPRVSFRLSTRVLTFFSARERVHVRDLIVFRRADRPAHLFRRCLSIWGEGIIHFFDLALGSTSHASHSAHGPACEGLTCFVCSARAYEWVFSSVVCWKTAYDQATVS